MAMPCSSRCAALLLLLLPCIASVHQADGGGEPLPTSSSQEQALLRWKSSLIFSSPALRSWRNSTHPCNWEGITCRRVRNSRVVTGVALPSAGLDGRLDGLNFSALPFVATVDLSNNSLRGPVPAAIGSLSQLTFLDISRNWLTGEIPSEIGNLGRLTQLGLLYNNFTGSIPASLGNLTMLTVLSLHQNMLSGDIPRELGRLVRLKALHSAAEQKQPHWNFSTNKNRGEECDPTGSSGSGLFASFSPSATDDEGGLPGPSNK